MSNYTLTPRHVWLRKRVIEVIAALNELESIEAWDEYRNVALELSKELNYFTVEWDKYYND